MKTTEKKIKDQPHYVRPIVEVLLLAKEDILTASNTENFGEWDPQLI